MIFKYSLVSDLHLDHPQPKTPPLEQNVIVAGDCGNGLVGLKYLNKLKRKGHFVFAAPGNHESYSNLLQGRTIQQTEEAFYQGLDQQQIIEVAEGLTVVGCNGWYRIDDPTSWRGYMNDWYCGDADEINRHAMLDAMFVDEALRDLRGRAIVVTHTAPTQHTLDPRFAGHFSNEWYYNPMMGEVMRRWRDKIAIWTHGHTHAAADEIVDGVRVVCNPRGYSMENPHWKPLTIEIEA